MGYPTPIEWTDATWNPVGGCSIVSPGCGPCYAQQLAGTRLKHHPLYAGTTDIVKGRPVFNGTMTAAPHNSDVWTWPTRWRGAAAPKLGHGMPSLIFVGDMSDLYHEHRQEELQCQAIGAITQSRHIGQLLTKRPVIMAAHLIKLIRTGRLARRTALLDHLWLGTSAERQKEFDERWPHLRQLAKLGFIVFISYEPAMGPLTLPADFLALGGRAWLIAGGCSGGRAWPAHPDWFRSVRDQCGAAGVPFFFKQWGEWATKVAAGTDVDMAVLPKNVAVWFGDGKTNHHRSTRVGKKAAGHLLDGVEHRAFPMPQVTESGANPTKDPS